MRYLILFLLLITPSVYAGDVIIEAGPTMLSKEYAKGGSVVLTERFYGTFDLSIGFITEQEVTTNRGNFYALNQNIFVAGYKVFHTNRFEYAVGVAIFQNTNRALGCELTLPVYIGYKLTHRTVFKYRHFSNAGSCTPNMGQDMFTLSYRF